LPRAEVRSILKSTGEVGAGDRDRTGDTQPAKRHHSRRSEGHREKKTASTPGFLVLVHIWHFAASFRYQAKIERLCGCFCGCKFPGATLPQKNKNGVATPD